MRKISYKIREHSLQKIPAIVCIGKREAEEGTVAVRRFGSKAQTVVKLDEFIQTFCTEVQEKVMFDPTIDTSS